MSETTFTDKDIRDLGTKLDEMHHSFDDRERTLLLAIIALADEALVARQKDEVTGFGGEASLPSVSEIVITKTTDTSSPGLFQACLGGMGSGLPQQSLSLNLTKFVG